MHCVKQYMNKLKETKKIMNKYNLDTSDVDTMIKEIKYFRVTSPIIGNFSTGKSSLINALVERRILSVDITPETAVPTEIYYGNNKVYKILSEYSVSKDESSNSIIKEIGIDELPLKNVSILDTDVIRIEYNNDFLRNIINVKLVDLPGFDSGIELHNKAIDKYLPNSLAYILVIAVDEPVLKENIENFLRELELHEMPLYIVLTKSARISKEELEACKQLVYSIVKKIITNSEVKIGAVESYGDIDIDDFKTFLYEIQSNAMDIFEKRYQPQLLNIMGRVEQYFTEQLSKSEFNITELSILKEELANDINEMLIKIEKEKESFYNQTEDCIKAIEIKIYNDLEASRAGFAAMIQSGKNVNERVNTIVRNAVSVGIKTEFEPRLQKYLKKISSMISIDITNDDNIKININNILNERLISEISRRALPFALAAVGTAVFPILGTAVGGLIGAFIDTAMNISQSKVKEKKANEVASEIINTVAYQAVDAVSREIRSYLVQINEDMEKDILKQKELLDKSLEDVEIRIALEERDRKEQITEIENDLEAIKDLMIM